NRRRAIQRQYNTDHGIVPATVRRAILDINPANGQTDYYAVPKTTSAKGAAGKKGKASAKAATPSDAEDTFERLEALRQEMFAAAENLQFETAARLRDEIKRLQRGEPGEAQEGAAKQLTKS